MSDPIQNRTETLEPKKIWIEGRGACLEGLLSMPEKCHGVVVFAHAARDARFHPRNHEIAAYFHRSGLGTLHLDLLMPEEMPARFADVPLQAERLVTATERLRHSEARNVPVGYFGEGVGGAAALWAASLLPGEIACVVCRGGRPDLARSRLGEVTSPTLLIVGEEDEFGVDVNDAAIPLLDRARLFLIPGATRLFEEPGALRMVAEVARTWFICQFEENAGGKAA